MQGRRGGVGGVVGVVSKVNLVFVICYVIVPTVLSVPALIGRRCAIVRKVMRS